MAMHAITANLQHRRGASDRLKKLHRETKKSFGACVRLIQELGPLDEQARVEGLGPGVHTNDAWTACVVLPKCLGDHVVRVAKQAKDWCAVQTREAAWVSIHLPCVRNSVTVDRAEAILEDVGNTLREWRRSARPPRWVVVGTDANV